MDAIKRYFWHRKYEAIIASPKGDIRQSLSHTDTGIREGAETHRQHFPMSKERILIAVLALSNVILLGLFIAGAKGHLSWRVGAIDGYNNRDINSDTKRTMGYSPILDLYDLKQASKTFNGALRDNSSIWRQPPSPEVDAAWDYISTEGCELITVSEKDVAKSGKEPSISLKAPSSWGEGDGAYIAQIEVFHQIHCLNELRKEMHYDYYYKTARTELHQSHKAHCLHMLLQSLMCTADVGIVTHNWVHNEHIAEPKTRPMPDFNVVKKCANFDGLLDWARKNAVKDMHKKWPELRYVPGMKIIKGDGYA